MIIELKVNQVIQLHPGKTLNKAFAGCLAVVEEVRSFGCLCYVQGLGKNRDESGYRSCYSAKWEEIVPLMPDGTVEWSMNG